MRPGRLFLLGLVVVAVEAAIVGGFILYRFEWAGTDVQPMSVVTVSAGPSSNSPTGYSPSSMTVVVGVNSTVEWVNRSGNPCTVTFTTIPQGSRGFDSGIILNGETFKVTFTVPGTYQYHCWLHEWMVGTVVVLPQTASD